MGDGSPITACACSFIFLKEERAVTTPRPAGGKQDEGWFLDTGATNDMTGSVDAFVELDRLITGKVWFPDGSMVDILGHRTIVFADKCGEHRAFTDIYFIPALKSNVMSVGQLDEGWFDIGIHHGVLTICDQQKRLLIEVTCSPNRLYKLFF